MRCPNCFNHEPVFRDLAGDLRCMNCHGLMEPHAVTPSQPHQDPSVTIDVSVFHGSFGRSVIKRDMGAPDWVNTYHEGFDLQSSVAYVQERIEQDERVVLVGYSQGTSHIARITRHICPHAVILYEPCILPPVKPAGTFPALIIWNDRGRKDWPEAKRTVAAWEEYHRVSMLDGAVGRHTSFAWDRWPMWGHAWDQHVNPHCKLWIVANVAMDQSRSAEGLVWAQSGGSGVRSEG